jgi:hypothetical protein
MSNILSSYRLIFSLLFNLLFLIKIANSTPKWWRFHFANVSSGIGCELHNNFQSGLIKLKIHLLDLLWICWTTSCTTCRKVVDLLYSFFRLVVESRKPYSTVSICCGFIVESTTNPQHLDMSRCCGFVEKSKSCGFVVDLLCNLLYENYTTNRSSGVWALVLANPQ